jgi:hypothetical protein
MGPFPSAARDIGDRRGRRVCALGIAAHSARRHRAIFGAQREQPAIAETLLDIRG